MNENKPEDLADTKVTLETTSLSIYRILSVYATVQGCNRKLKGGKKPLKYI